MNLPFRRDRPLPHFSYGLEVDASPATAWEVISDHAALATWLPVGKVSLWPARTSRSDGVGTVRALAFHGHSLVERMVESVPQTSVTFKLVSGLGHYCYVYTVHVRPSLSGCMLSVAAIIDLPAPVAAVVAPVVLRLVVRAAAREITRRARAPHADVRLAS